MNDMQNHVLPYLQSFCSLEEKGVQERWEQQIAEKQDGMAGAARTTKEMKVESAKSAGKATPARQSEAKKENCKSKETVHS